MVHQSVHRVRKTLARANQKLSFQLAAWLLAGSTLLSSFLGIYRDRLLNGRFLDVYPVSIDAYTVAFTIPDFMYFVLVSGALSVTFIPVFNQRLATGNKKSAWELSTSLMNFMAILTLIASVLIVIFADPLVRYVVGPGLSEPGHNLAVAMMRVIAVNPFLFAVATVIASMQQAVGRFTFYTLAPIIYNIGIIIGVVFFTKGITIFGWHIFDGGIMGVVLGVVLGSIMQLIVSSAGLIGLGFDYRFKIYWKNRGFRQVLRLLPARSLDQSIDYINSIVETNLASRMADGTVRAYQQASTLSNVPINLIGVAISNAAFPKMTERLSTGRSDLFRSELRSVLRVIIWLALPVATIAYFTRGYLVNFIFNRSDNFSQISDLMAGLLGALAIAILFRSIYHIMARSFYAQQDTRTPLYISIFTIGLNIGLAIWFTQSLHMGAYGLAWAQSIVAAVEVIILMSILVKRVQGIFTIQFWKALARMLSATGFTALVCYLLVVLMPLRSSDQNFFSVFPKFVFITGASLLFYVWVSNILRLPEPRPIIAKAREILFAKLGANR